MGREVWAGFLEERVEKIRAWKGRVRAGATRLGVRDMETCSFIPVPQCTCVLHPSIRPSFDPFYIYLSEQGLQKPFPHQLELSH